MNNTESRAHARLRFFKIAAIIIAALSAITAAFAFLVSSEPETRYLSLSAATVAMYSVIGVSVAVAFSSLFLFKGHSIVKDESQEFEILSLLPAVGALIVIIDRILSPVPNGKPSLTDALLIVTAIVASLLSIAKAFKLSATVKMIASYSQIFFTLIFISCLYLEPKVEINAPVKLLAQFALAAVALSTLSNIRIMIERSMAGAYVFTKICLAALAFSAAAATVTAIAMSADKYPRAYLSASLFALCYSIHALIEFFRAEVKAKNQESTPTEPIPEAVTDETVETAPENDGK